MIVPPAIEGSWDNIIHKQSNGSNSLLLFKGGNNERNKTEDILVSKEIKTNKRRKMRGQRAIGVVYNPAYEKYGNYVPTVLTKRYDAFVYIDETHALHPLHMPQVKVDKEEIPETFPTGL
jgi:erythromycin esterase-like protein